MKIEIKNYRSFIVHTLLDNVHFVYIYVHKHIYIST